MKEKKAIQKALSCLLTGILSLLGFSSLISCPMYGMPSAKYTIKGAISDEITGDPIKGLRVGYNPIVWDDDLFGPPPETPDYSEPSTKSVFTNEKGGFELTSRGSYFPRENNTIFIYVEDIDGKENNLYQAKKTEVDFSDSIHNTIGVGSFYEGEFIKIINVKMTEILDHS